MPKPRVHQLDPADGNPRDFVRINADGTEVEYSDASDLGGIQSIVPGTNVTVDDTDPANPIVSASGGGGGGSGIILAQPQGSLARAYHFDSTIESWTASGGTLTWDSGKFLKHTAAASATAYYLLEDSSAAVVADGEYVIDLHSVSGAGGAMNAGILFRATNVSNTYLLVFRFNDTTPGVELYKRVAGTLTSLGGNDSGLDPGGARFPINGVTDTRVMVRFVGSVIRAYINEVLVGVWNDTTYTTGLVGAFEFSSGSSQVYMWDNALIYSLSSSWTPPPYDA